MANTVEILVEARDNASRALDKIGKSTDTLTDKLRKMRGPLLAIGGGLTGLAVVGVKAASDLGESINAVNVIFGEGADTILKFGENSARAVGLATADFNQLATVTGALLKDVGLPMNEVADMTNELAVRAADMASVMNTDVKDAMSAIQQAMRGEAEAIRRFGGDVTQASLQQYALAQGISTAVTEMTEQEKRLLRVGLLMQQTEMFAGDFANTQESFANQTKILRAELTNMAAKMGEDLIPMINVLITGVRKAVGVFTELSPQVRTAAVVAGVLTAGLAAVLLILPLVVNGFVALKTAVIAAKVAMIAFHATAFFPITVGLAVLGVALVAGFAAWKFFGDGVRSIMEDVAQFVVDAFNNIREKINAVIDGINLVAGLFDTKIPRIPPLVIDIGSAFDTAGEKLNKFKEGAIEKLDAVKALITTTKKEAESLFDEFEFDEDTIAPVRKTAADVLKELDGEEGIAALALVNEQARMMDVLVTKGLGDLGLDILSGNRELGLTIKDNIRDLKDAVLFAGDNIVDAVKATMPEDPLEAITAAREERKNLGISAWIQDAFRGTNKTLPQVGAMAEMLTPEGRARALARQKANTQYFDAEGNLLTGEGGTVAPQPGAVMAAPVVNVFIDGKDLATHVESHLGDDAADNEQTKGGS